MSRTVRSRHLHVLAIIAAICALSVHAFAATLGGTIIDAAGKPVANAQVILCNAQGVPLMASFQTPGQFLSDPKSHTNEDSEKFAFTTTDASGVFNFAQIPVGSYRLVAQSWPEQPVVEKLINFKDEPNGAIVQLYGIADSLTVTDQAPATVTIKPLGTGTLTVNVEIGNSGTLLFASPSALKADPILGFAGWCGPFMEHWVGANQMPYGKTELRKASPEGMIHVVLFANDNLPGFAAGQAEIKNGATATLDLRFVAPWSDGLHEPPAELKALVEEVRTLDAKTIRALTPSVPRSTTRPTHRVYAMIPENLEILDRPVRLPSGKSVRNADFAAAKEYIRMERALNERKAKAVTSPQPGAKSKPAQPASAPLLGK